MRAMTRCLLMSVLAVLVAACGDEGPEASLAGNSAPTITGTPRTSIGVAENYMFQPAAADANGDALIFGIDGKPAWLAFNTSTGRLTGTPGSVDVGTYRGIVIWVSDGTAQSLLPAFDVTVRNAIPNRAPVITGTPSSAVAVGRSYEFTPSASDPDGDDLVFSITGGGAWLAFDASTGRLTGTPGTADAGTYANIVLTVSDGERSATLPAFDITVAPAGANSAPSITGVPGRAVVAGMAYGFTPGAADADGDPLTFSITNPPGWASFNPATGRLSGTPSDAQVGIYPGIVISVSDGIDVASLAAFSITVEAASTNEPPAISGTPPITAQRGVLYDFRPDASDVDGDSLVFSVVNRPSWATFNRSTGRLRGTPGSSHVRTYSNIRISVSDGQAAVEMAPFAITVEPAPNGVPTISGTPATSVQAGTAYAFQPSASDPDGNALTFSIANRPSWASFSTSTGRLSGTPSAAQAGNYSGIVISVSDGTASASLPAFTLVVEAVPNGAPTISGTPATSVQAGTAYAFQPSASDPNGDPLTYIIQNRPSWASFNTSTGRLSGTPTLAQVNTYANIVVSVTDGTATAALPAFSIVVTAVPNGAVPNGSPTISGTPSGAVLVGSAYSFQPSASDPDSDTLTFSIQNRPTWATFSTSTGRLSGTPAAQHVGTYGNIVIRVSDGAAEATLPAFGIEVQAIALGSATLSWIPPTAYEDGTSLNGDLAGFRIYWGTSSGSYPNSVTLNNPGLTTYMVENLVPGTYYFTSTAFTDTGAESVRSNEAVKVIP